jgi:hypothetical protein
MGKGQMERGVYGAEGKMLHGVGSPQCPWTDLAVCGNHNKTDVTAQSCATMRGMKWVIISVLLISSLAFAKHKPKPAPVYDHVATMIYHAAQFKYLLEGRTDIFYDDEHECTPGDEHHAPTCRTHSDWTIETQKEFKEINLDDGRRVILDGDAMSWCTSERCTPTSNVWIANPSDLPDLPREIIDENPPGISPEVARILNEARHKNDDPRLTPPAPLKDGGTVEFHYRLLVKEDIEVKPREIKTNEHN